MQSKMRSHSCILLCLYKDIQKVVKIIHFGRLYIRYLDSSHLFCSEFPKKSVIYNTVDPHLLYTRLGRK